MRTRGTRALLAVAIAAVAALIPAAGASAGTLDQQQTTPGFGSIAVDASFSRAQTFTSGLTGQLDQVDLKLQGQSLTTPLTVQIRDGSGTGPGTTVLATTTVPTSAVTDGGPVTFVPIAFTTPAPVTAGTQYAVVAMNNSIGWAWEAGIVSPTSPYVAGKPYGSPGFLGAGPWSEGNGETDFEFKTYVVPPPPSGGGPSTTTPPTTTQKKKCKKKAKHSAASAKKKKCKKKKKK